MDVHKNEHTVAMYVPGSDEPEVFTVKNNTAAIRRMVKKVLRRADGPVSACYEAGVLGFSLQRQWAALGIPCAVIAPSLVPVQPGQRVRTDSRDARKWGACLRAGMLTEVHPPDTQQESVRDLCRWRQAAQKDLTRVRHQVSKFVLRRGLVYREGTNWTQKHHRWLAGLAFEEALDRELLEAMLWELDHRQRRLKAWDERMEAVAAGEAYREPVGWLCCLRGFQTVTALSIVAELHGVERFASARELMSYLGLTPSENSSGLTERKGRITKAGNARVRRLLVEAAWHQRRPVRASRTIAKRRAGQPAWAVRLAERAERRLYRRYWHLVNRGKMPTKAVTAVARELAGFVWAMLRLQERCVDPPDAEAQAGPKRKRTRPSPALAIS